jgi:hypothetical protein
MVNHVELLLYIRIYSETPFLFLLPHQNKTHISHILKCAEMNIFDFYKFLERLI